MALAVLMEQTIEHNLFAALQRRPLVCLSDRRQ
jgi:hypothetical protein